MTVIPLNSPIQRAVAKAVFVRLLRSSTALSLSLGYLATRLAVSQFREQQMRQAVSWA